MSALQDHDPREAYPAALARQVGRAPPRSASSELIDNIVFALRTVFDPEIPVNIYDLGLIYHIDIRDDRAVEIDMTLTAPCCPVASVMVGMVRDAVGRTPGVTSATVNLVFDPPWDQSRMSEEVQLELGLL